MPRKYTKIKDLEPEVFQMKEEGKTNREIAEHYGLELEQIKNLIKRHNRNEQRIKQGDTPKVKGCPRKRPMTADEEKDKRIAQLADHGAMPENPISNISSYCPMANGSVSNGRTITSFRLRIRYSLFFSTAALSEKFTTTV